MTKVNQVISQFFDLYEDVERVTIKPDGGVLVTGLDGEEVSSTVTLDLSLLSLVAQCPHIQQDLQANYYVVLVRINPDDNL